MQFHCNKDTLKFKVSVCICKVPSCICVLNDLSVSLSAQLWRDESCVFIGLLVCVCAEEIGVT